MNGLTMIYFKGKLLWGIIQHISTICPGSPFSFKQLGIFLPPNMFSFYSFGIYMYRTTFHSNISLQQEDYPLPYFLQGKENIYHIIYIY